MQWKECPHVIITVAYIDKFVSCCIGLLSYYTCAILVQIIGYWSRWLIISLISKALIDNYDIILAYMLTNNVISEQIDHQTK